MARSLRLALALAYLTAAAVPCAAPDSVAELAPETLRAYAAGAVHAHGAPPENAAGEFRAPCPCGCDESPADRLVSSPLGAALAPASSWLALPRAALPAAPVLGIAERSASPPDVVPRPA